jgi:hypothetical protein
VFKEICLRFLPGVYSIYPREPALLASSLVLQTTASDVPATAVERPDALLLQYFHLMFLVEKLYDSANFISTFIVNNASCISL